MRQYLQFMDQHQYQSNEEKLHQLLLTGDTEAITALHRQGVNLEMTDKEGKTPLMKACTHGGMLNVAITLIVLGSRVDAFCPGREGGTSLHFAAGNDLEPTILLLLSNGANAYLRNDDGKTALDVARMKGSVKAVRVIENHICCVSGWLREYHGSRFMRAVAPQSHFREIWVVVIPRETGISHMPPEMELAIYRRLQDAQPYKVIDLSKSRIKKAKLHNPDPCFTLIDLPAQTPCKFSSVAGNGGKEQLLLFYDICNGVCGNQHDSRHQASSLHVRIPPFEAENDDDEDQMALAIISSIDYANKKEEADFLAAVEASLDSAADSWSQVSSNYGMTSRDEGSSSRWMEKPDTALEQQSRLSSRVATAPPLPDDNTCMICCEAPVEGACIPCGHMNCCMTCLMEIKTRKNGCPICRAKIERVIRIHIC